MQALPFEIPGHLSSYITQFESDPENGINNLKTYLKKRGSDAAGNFLLAWLHNINGQQDQAIEYALKAKCCAPGSPFMEHLHYFLVHPERFNAWKPFHSDSGNKNQRSPMIESGYALNLDLLIEQLSKVENHKITINPDKKDNRNLGEKSESVGDVASETLAGIYEQQKRYEEAIRTLKILQKTNPDNVDAYSAEIQRIESLKMQEESAGKKS